MSASDDVVITGDLSSQSVRGHQVSVFVDDGKRETLPEILAYWQQGLFAAGYTGEDRSALGRHYWHRLVLANDSARALKVSLVAGAAHTDHVALFVPDYQGRLLHREAGDSQPWLPVSARSRIPVFELELPPYARLPIYVKSSALLNKNDALGVWDPDLLQRREAKIHMMYGVLFGSMSLLVLFVMAAFFRRRDAQLLRFAGCVLSTLLCLFLLHGFSTQIVPVTTFVPVDKLLAMTAGLMLGFGLSFFRRYLKLSEHSVVVDEIARVLQWCCFSLLLSSMMPPSLQTFMLILGFGVTSVLSILYVCYAWFRRGGRLTLFAVGWIVLSASELFAAPWVQSNLPHFPAYHYLVHLPALGAVFGFICMGWVLLGAKVPSKALEAGT